MTKFISTGITCDILDKGVLDCKANLGRDDDTWDKIMEKDLGKVDYLWTGRSGIGAKYSLDKMQIVLSSGPEDKIMKCNIEDRKSGMKSLTC